MKKILFSAAIAVCVGSTAIQAADLAPQSYPAPAPVYTKAPPPAPNWTGFYVGGNAGYSWGAWDTTSNQHVFNFESLTEKPKVNGPLGGLQIGYNWQGNGSRWVWGIEADIQLTGEKKTLNWSDPELPPSQPAPPPCAPGLVLVGGICVVPVTDFVPRSGGPATLSSQWEFPWFGTARVRGGYAPDPDWLIYGTGGLAFGEAQYKFNFSQPGAAANSPPAPTNYSLATHDTRIGFALGAGAETKLDKNWSVKFEYLYVDLGTTSINTKDIDGQPFRVEYRVRDQIGRIGLNYAFK